MTRFLRGVPFVAVGVLMLSLSSPAQAQFGGLINKAREKAAENAAPVAPGEQLTDDLLGKVLTGVQAADRVLAERDQLVAARDKKEKDYSALVDKNAPVHSAYNEASSKIEGCRSASFASLGDVRSAKLAKDLDAKKSDPAYIGKMQLASLKYGKAMAEAQKNNDPVAMQKAQRDLQMDMGGMDFLAEMKKDTVATDAKCGKMPALPASIAQEEPMRKSIADDDANIRTLEAKALNEGAKASGMDQVRYLQLKERAVTITHVMAGQGPKVKFGDDETNAVKKRMGDLDKYKRAL
jgi:hypothetical protein